MTLARPELVREMGRLRGTVYYRVTGANSFAEAYAADGLPATGDPFDEQHAFVRAYRYAPEPLPGSGGMWRMRVEYKEDGDGAGDITPAEGLRVTTAFEQNRTTETVDADATLTHKLTHDGSGVPKIVNAITLRVVTFSTSVPDIAPLIELSDSPKVNSAPVTLPAFLGSEQTLLIPEGQLLYAGFRPYRQGEFYVVEHELMLRRDWRHHKYPVDANGEPVGGVIERLDVYETADFVAALGG
jgi:hypothetical protein